jgi:hypothetical protein
MGGNRSYGKVYVKKNSRHASIVYTTYSRRDRVCVSFLFCMYSQKCHEKHLISFDHAPTCIRGNPRASRRPRRRRRCTTVVLRRTCYRGDSGRDACRPHAGRLPGGRRPSSRWPGRPRRPPPCSRAADPAGGRLAAERVGGRLRRRERRGERRRRRVVRGTLRSPAGTNAAAAAQRQLLPPDQQGRDASGKPLLRRRLVVGLPARGRHVPLRRLVLVPAAPGRPRGPRQPPPRGARHTGSQRRHGV